MNPFNVTCKALAKLAFFAAIVIVSIPVYATPTVTVSSPRPGISAGSPIFYEAYATSPTCTKGISAMRIYSGPNVAAFTVSGAHLETFLTLAPGTYNSVVQAWDKCGGVGKISVSVTVNSTSGISVFLPSGTSASAPVHIAASAQNSACAAGMSAIRIYTGNGVSPYTIRSNQLNTYLNFLPGTYGLTVKAWDKCGHVFKSQSTELVTSTSDAYLYAVNMRPTAPDLYQFKIASDGTLKNPNGSNALPEFSAGSGASALAADPGGWFVYASSLGGVYGYQINRSNGNLVPMPGSPFPLNGNPNGESFAPLITVDPSGNFIFARYGGPFGAGRGTTYRINRSSGALTSTGFFVNTSWHVFSFDFSGQYLYLVNFGFGLDGWRLDPNNGNLIALQGSPYFFNSLSHMYRFSSDSAGTYLYVGGGDNSGNGNDGNIATFTLNYVTGVPVEMSGSPLIVPNWQVAAILTDVRTRFLWTFQQGPTLRLQEFGIGGTGSLVPSSSATQIDPYYLVDWAKDHSGKYVFTSYGLHNDPYNGIASWPISTNGDLKTQTLFPTANGIGSVTVVRSNPN